METEPQVEYHCEHTNIEDDSCLDCGLIIEDSIIEYETKTPANDPWINLRFHKKEAFSYYDKLAFLELDPVIAVNVCKQVSRLCERSHIRVSKYTKNLFVMIYIAYISEGKEFNPGEIGKKLKMKPKEVREAIKLASSGIDECADRNPVCIISPFNFIREIANIFKDIHEISDDNFKRIEELIDIIMGHNQMLCNENPKGIATVILKMYYDHNGINVPGFFRKTKRTMGYIKVRENMIISTLNSI